MAAADPSIYGFSTQRKHIACSLTTARGGATPSKAAEKGGGVLSWILTPKSHDFLWGFRVCANG